MARFHRTGTSAVAESNSKSSSKSDSMKWLSGGLTFVNFDTVYGLLIGMLTGTCASILHRFYSRVLRPSATGGLSPTVSWIALRLAAGFARLAYPTPPDP